MTQGIRGMSYRKLGAQFDIRDMQVLRIVKRKSWAHAGEDT